MRVAIHQPNFMPWLGFFDKMKKADVFVLLDDVQLSQPSYTNRSQILTKSGAQLITVPVKGSGLIKDAHILQSNWGRKAARAIEMNYQNAPNYIRSEWYYALTNNYSTLLKLNVGLICWMRIMMDIRTPMVLSSDLGISSTGTSKLIGICKALGADTYLSGSGEGAKRYVDTTLFNHMGINVEFNEFEHPQYPQQYKGFTPNLSAIDYIFNVE